MTRTMRFFSELREQTRGSVAIETAIVAPMLVLLALGSFDAGRLVARQAELQSAAAEAEAVVQAAVPKDQAARDEIRDMLKSSLDPGNTNPNETVSVAEIYRCSTDADYVTVNNCGTGVVVSTFIKITLTDRYTPQWTTFGIGSPVDYRVVRMVQLS